MGSKGPAKPVFASPTVLETTVAGSVIEGLVTRWGWRGPWRDMVPQCTSVPQCTTVYHSVP